MAWVYDRYAKGYEAVYPLQDEARAAKRGLWSQPAVKLWEWRANLRETRGRSKALPSPQRSSRLDIP